MHMSILDAKKQKGLQNQLKRAGNRIYFLVSLSKGTNKRAGS